MITTGRLVGNETAMRGQGWPSLFRRRKPYDFPVLSFVVEHPEGPIAIDTGMSRKVRVPLPQRRIAPHPLTESVEEIGPQMRAAGVDTHDLRRLVLTHLDWDHTGGLEQFPNAEVLDPEPYGPFPESKALTESGDVRLVPIPGHTIGQVGVIVRTDDVALFFAADHTLRQDWFVDDYEAGRLSMLGAFFYPEAGAETSRRIHRFVEEVPTVFIPSHDADAPTRLAALEPLKLNV